MRLARRGFTLAALATLAFAVGCSSDSNSNTATKQDLSGTYTLVTPDGLQFTPLGQSTASIAATGSALLTAKDYTINLTVTDPLYAALFPPTSTGTYVATGTPESGSFAQIPSNAQQPQATGTYTYNATTKTLVLTTDVASFGKLRIELVKN